jgi:hypothetical protein
MTAQAEFSFKAPPADLADASAELVEFLRDNPGFHTARELGAFLSIPERRLRQLAAAAGGRIVSGPGSPGYCHVTHCPADQISHIADTLLSQGRAMIRRAIRTRQLAHGIIR